MLESDMLPLDLLFSSIYSAKRAAAKIFESIESGKLGYSIK